MATVHIPPQLQRFTEGARQVEVPGATLREIVDALERRFPGIRDCLLEEDRMRPGMNAAVDSVVHPTGLRTAVQPGSEVHFIPAISGGSIPAISGESSPPEGRADERSEARSSGIEIRQPPCRGGRSESRSTVPRDARESSRRAGEG